MAQELVVKVCYGTGNGCLGVLWHGMVVQVLWHRNLLLRCVMVYKHSMQMCYGTGTDCSHMLWHRTWLFMCVVAQEMVLHICYDTKKGHMMTTTNFGVP